MTRFVLGLVVLVVAACGGSSGTGRSTGGSANGGVGDRGDAENAGTGTRELGDAGSPSGNVCVPNETQLCNGPGACDGAQSCREDGSGWETCDCGDSTGGKGSAGGSEEGATGAGGSAGDPGAGASSSGGIAAGGAPAGGTGGNEPGGSHSGGTITGDTGGSASGGALTGGDTGVGGGLSLTCGDSVVDAGEACDDGNSAWGDGCTPSCRLEPVCDFSGCTSACGDGLLISTEECDDGNRHDGDGCSADCTVESGYECARPPLGDRIVVPVVYRDFLESHPDFEPSATGCDEVSPGMVALDLDAEGKPVLDAGAAPGGGCNLATSASSFSEWYRDVPTVNAAFVSTLALYANGSGYVNRYGPNGEQYVKYSLLSDCWCGSVGQEELSADGTPIPCTFCPLDEPDTPECDYPQETDCGPGGACEDLVECVVEADDTYRGVTVVDTFDGNPFFFPVDASTFTPNAEFAAAVLSPPYGDTWAEEPGAPLHNFHFTSEVRFWFEYRAGTEQQLSFTGDDDVWVFINRKLAVDLGGIHVPLSSSVNLDLMATDLALVDGGLYEIVVFQAERQTEGSTYQLTLAGFNTAPSVCRPN